ncbi:hypothetical protein LTR66_002269 [Elasticomyces elasticus]|nr:hypothetical protein LTR66_002269 [Elasticomyces elasticus]
MRGVEVLVHATAASGRKDDNKYQAQAQAYLHFEAETRIEITSQYSSLDAQYRENHRAAGKAKQWPTSQDYIDDTQLGLTFLESQLITSSIAIAEDPEVQQCSQPGSPIYEKNKVSSPTSQNEHPTELSGRPAKRVRLSSAGHQPSSRSSDALLPAFIPIREDGQYGVGFVGQYRAETGNHEFCGLATSPVPQNSLQSLNKGDSILSELPTSYPLSDGVSSEDYRNSDDVLSRHRVSSDSMMRVGDRVRLGCVAEAGGNISGLEVGTAAALSQAPSVSDAQNIAAVKTKTLQSQDIDLAVLQAISNLPTSIHPEPPDTASEPFGTHITDSLRLLDSHGHVTRCWRAAVLLREPRQSERGYWLVDATPWSPNLQLEFWQFLQDLIGSGKAGWGVWCTREQDAGLDPRTITRSDSGVSEACAGRVDGQPSGLGMVRIFCFGEVVRHVYLVLYVASKSKIKMTSAIWVDAQGETLVQMQK